MEEEAVANFEGKFVKLEYLNNFNIKGTILKVYKDSILFKTHQATSAILLSNIKSIVEMC